MARSLEELRPGISATEFGPPVQVSLTTDQAIDLGAASRRWKERLGLPSEPFELVSIGPGRYELSAKHVTGFVRAAGLDIEIIPKFLEANETGGEWRRALWRTLALVNESFVADDPTSAAEDPAAFSFTDLMADVFVASFIHGSARGLPRGYQELRLTSRDLKGTLDLSRVALMQLTPWEIPIRVDVLTTDVQMNRLFRWAIRRLYESVRSSKRARLLRELDASLVGVSPNPPSRIEARRLILGPQYRSLEPALMIARLLLDTQTLQHEMGDRQLGGFLWKSSDVFEALVTVLVRRAARSLGYLVSKRETVFGRTVIGTAPNLKTTPDLRLRKNGVDKIVIDAKYKIKRSRPQASDAYQVVAAGRALASENVALMYPKAAGDALESFGWRIEGFGMPRLLHAIVIDIRLMQSQLGEMELVDQIKKWLLEIGAENQPI